MFLLAAVSPARTKHPVNGCVLSAGSWMNVPVAQQTGSFRVTYNASASAVNVDGVTGLSSGAANDFSNLAAVIRTTAALELEELIYAGRGEPVAYSRDLFAPGAIEVMVMRSLESPRPEPVLSPRSLSRAESDNGASASRRRRRTRSAG